MSDDARPAPGTIRTAFTDPLTKKLDSLREAALDLPAARAAGLVCIVRGDEGGQVYFTIPASMVSCTQDRLVQLALDVDFVHWHDPIGVHLTFEEIEDGTVAGGMGGGLATDSVWIHDTFMGSRFAARIEQVLLAERTSLWPSGSSAFGEPYRALDLLEGLEEENGDGPVFDLIRAAVRLRRLVDADSCSHRFLAVLRKMLGAREPRNRIEAAQRLIGAMDPSLLVKAVYEAGSGEIAFPMWGMWQRRAAYVLGSVARSGDRSGYDALALFSSADAWIQKCGPYVFAWPRWIDAQEEYSDPAAFRAEFSRVFRAFASS